MMVNPDVGYIVFTHSKLSLLNCKKIRAGGVA